MQPANINYKNMNKNCTLRLLLIICIVFIGTPAKSQTAIYPQHFALDEVTLLDSPYKTAMDRNIDVLLQYDTDRLLTPFVRQAGLSATTDTSSPYYNWEELHPNFENWAWNPSFALDGHVGGHYLSALSLAYAACHDASTKAELLERVNYIISVLNDCQRAFDDNTEGLKGYIGGLPDNSIWTGLYAGNNAQFSERSAWVPFYCIHKAFAGLRDAYLYAGNATALSMLKDMGDWAINVVANFAESDMDSLILWNEHGGMNEVLADLYSLTGDERYLAAAKKYSHKEMLNGMQTLDTTFLDYLHSNCQVAKYIGFERISQVDPSAANYNTAAVNYWTDIVDNRTSVIGGNGVDEYLFPQTENNKYINNSNGPETCCTYNMLKLTENLFDDSHEAKYAEYYENATLNHILSTQDPATGGYVYFTPLRPQSYHVYSVVNEAMWCCLGTGMENHSKYGHFIYTHSADNSVLWINLFTASKLDSDNFSLTQETAFPYGDTSNITVNKSGSYTIAVRHPAWTTDDYKVTVNGSDVTSNVTKGTASYVEINRSWTAGDVITVTFPMELSIEALPEYENYVAIKYGPVVLAACTTSSDPNDENYEELTAQYAGTGRMDHAPGNVTTLKSLNTAPMLIGDRDNILEERISNANPDSLTFTLDVSYTDSEWSTLQLIPFYKAQNARYMVYWNQMTEEEYEENKALEDEAALELENRTIDFVATGEQQSEAGHACSSSGSTTGNAYGEYYRDAYNDSYFEYTMWLDGVEDVSDISIMFRYNVFDAGRTGYIYIDGELLRTVTIPSSVDGADPFYNDEYYIPSSMLIDADGNIKTQITVRMEGSSETFAPGVYYIRLLTGYEGPRLYSFVCTDWITGDTGRIPQSNIVYDEDANTIDMTATGTNNICLNMSDDAMDSYYTRADQNYLVVCGTNLSLVNTDSYLWWLNGVNKGSSFPATYTTDAAGGKQLVVWDITQSGINDNMNNTVNNLTGWTIFGVTSTDSGGNSVITDVSFYSPAEAAETYPELEAVNTGINNIHVAKTRDNRLYNLQGMEITRPARGIYIRNGKKIVF